ARVQPRPPAHHCLDPVRADHDSGAPDLLTAWSPHANAPAAVAVALHPRRLRRDADLDAHGPRPLGEDAVEPRTVADPRPGPVGDAHLSVVRRGEDDARAAARHPGRAARADALATPRG